MLRQRKQNGESGSQRQDQSECAEFAALRRDPAMDKYFKMLGFGVPASGVAQKMVQDNVDLETVRVFSAGPSGPDTSAPSLTRWRVCVSELSSMSNVVGDGNRSGTLLFNCRRESVGDSRRLGRRGSSAFRKVHWTSLETTKASESIWTRVTTRRQTAPIALSPQDFQALESLFGGPTSSASGAASREARAGNAGRKKVTALDSRRSNNISIGLSQFKALGGVDAIVVSLKACDFAFLTAERLATLCEIAPTAVEAKRYTNFRGSRARLEASERFLVEMCTIPRVTEEVSA